MTILLNIILALFLVTLGTLGKTERNRRKIFYYGFVCGILFCIIVVSWFV